MVFYTTFMTVTIAGNGVFGKAMFHVLQQNNVSVRMAKREEPITDADILVLCVPAQAIRDVLKLVTFPKKGIIVNTAKGIERKTHAFPFQIVTEIFGKKVEYYSLMGPSFAQEINEHMPTLVNLGYQKNAAHPKFIQKLFQTDFFRVRLNEGVAVLEIAAAMKNVYAIGCGLVDGLGYGENTKAKIQILAIEEMIRLFHGLHLRMSRDMIAGTVGDLILTCAGRDSRNFRFGKLFSQYSTADALTKINSTVEGYDSLFSLPVLQQRAGVKLPLASFIARVVKDKHGNLKKEFEEFVRKT